MQHSHTLVIDERKVLWRPEIQEEIKLYLEAGLTMPMIVNAINRKFGLSVTYRCY